MRLNKFVALASGISRRAADDAIARGRVYVDGKPAELGQQVDPEKNIVTLDNKPLSAPEKPVTIMLNKPVGYVCSRDGQGSKTIYDLLPEKYHNLKPVGRLDKDSSGLLLLTNDGTLAYEMTHPSFKKEKKYLVQLGHVLSEADFGTIAKTGVQLKDGLSKFGLDSVNDDGREWRVTMHEGRNRQIRRTLEALGYNVSGLHRTHFGPYELNSLKTGEYIEL